MGNLTTLIFVAFVIVLGIGTVWVIAANGSMSTTPVDTFGDTPPAQAMVQNNASADMAVKTMPMLLIAFIIMVCVILVAAFAWFWKTGNSKASKY